MKQNSFFYSASVCKPLKKLGAYLLDFFITFIIMMALFGISEGISNNLSVVKNVQSELNATSESMYALVLDAQLGQANEEGILVSQDTIVRNYIYGATYESLIKNEDSSLSESTYEGYEAITPENDNCYHYYVVFKTANKDQFKSDQAQSETGFDYYYQELTNADSDDSIESYFTVENDYPYISYETAKDLDEYFRNSGYSTGKTIYDNLDTSYRALLVSGINEITLVYTPYLELNDAYNQMASYIYMVKDIELFITYILSLLIVFVLIPFFLGDGRTLTYKILGLGVTDMEGKEAALYQLFLRALVLVIEYAFLFLLTVLVFYGTSGLDLLGTTLFGNISFLSLSLFSLLVMCFSYLFSLMLPSKRQAFSEFVSRTILKDSKTFIAKKKGLKDGEGK